MDCETVQEKYQQFLDNELNDSEAGSFQQHLKNCDQCGRILKFERHFHMTITKKISRNFKKRAPSNDLMERIRSELF